MQNCDSGVDLSQLLRDWRKQFPEDRSSVVDFNTIFTQCLLLKPPPVSLDFNDAQQIQNLVNDLNHHQTKIAWLKNFLIKKLSAADSSNESNCEGNDRHTVVLRSNNAHGDARIGLRDSSVLLSNYPDDAEFARLRLGSDSESLDEYLDDPLDEEIEDPEANDKDTKSDIVTTSLHLAHNDSIKRKLSAKSNSEMEEPESPMSTAPCVRERRLKTVHQRLSLLGNDEESPLSPTNRSVKFNLAADFLGDANLRESVEEADSKDALRKSHYSRNLEDLRTTDRHWELDHILADERRHRDILNLLCKYSMAFKSKVPSESVDQIFYKVSILHDDQVNFVTALEERLKNFDANDENTSISDLVDTLLKNQSLIQEYAVNIPRAVKQLDLIFEDKTFSNLFLATAIIKVEGKDVRLRDLIQQPAVWLTKTAENLKRLAEKTPDNHVDFIPLQSALNKIRETLSRKITLSGKDCSHEEISSCDNCRVLQKNSLMVELGPNNSRKLRHVFLFPDLLVCAKQKYETVELATTHLQINNPNYPEESSVTGGVSAPSVSNLSVTPSHNSATISPRIISAANVTSPSVDQTNQSGTTAQGGSGLAWQQKLSSLEVKWFIPITSLILYKVNDFENEETRLKRKADIESLKQKIKILKIELKKEAKELASGKDKHYSSKKDAQFSFRKYLGPRRQMEKLKEQLVKHQANLILLSPNLKFCVGSGSEKQRTLFMSSEHERASWREAIQYLRTREQDRLPISFTSAEVNHRLELYKETVIVNSIGSYLLADADDGLISGIMKTTIHTVVGVKPTKDNSLFDYYVCVEVDSFEHFERVAKTTTVSSTGDPIWNESFDIDLDSSQMARFLLYRNGQVITQLDLKLDLESLENYIEINHVVRTMDNHQRQMLMTVSLSYTDRVQTLARQPSKFKEALFGVPLDRIVKRENLRNQSQEQIPLIIQLCVQEIEQRGLKEVGIYRVSGSSTDVADLKRDFEKKVLGAKSKLSKVDIHVVSGVLKSYLRELPDPVLLGSNYHLLMAATDIPTEEEKTKAFNFIVNKLPEPNLTTFKFLLKHFVKVCTNHEVNRMVVGNLGLIFGPTLMCPATSTLSQDILLVTLESMNQAKTLTQIIIMARDHKMVGL